MPAPGAAVDTSDLNGSLDSVSYDSAAGEWTVSLNAGSNAESTDSRQGALWMFPLLDDTGVELNSDNYASLFGLQSRIFITERPRICSKIIITAGFMNTQTFSETAQTLACRIVIGADTSVVGLKKYSIQSGFVYSDDNTNDPTLATETQMLSSGHDTTDGVILDSNAMQQNWRMFQYTGYTKQGKPTYSSGAASGFNSATKYFKVEKDDKPCFYISLVHISTDGQHLPGDNIVKFQASYFAPRPRPYDLYFKPNPYLNRGSSGMSQNFDASSSLPTNWSSVSGAGEFGWAVSSEKSFSGSNSVRAPAVDWTGATTGNTAKLQRSNLSVTKGQTLSFMMYVEGSQRENYSDLSAKLNISALINDSGDVWVVQRTECHPLEEWTQYSIEVPVTVASCNLEFWVSIVEADSSAKIYIDEITLS